MKIVLVQKANRQLRIPEDKLNYYIQLGYREVNKKPPAKESKAKN